MTLEHQRVITVFEAKNGSPRDFNVFQLFNPYRYYLRATEDMDVESIQCCYLVRQRNRRRGDKLRLYLYSFADPQNPGSIYLERNAELHIGPAMNLLPENYQNRVVNNDRDGSPEGFAGWLR